MSVVSSDTVAGTGANEQAWDAWKVTAKEVRGRPPAFAADAAQSAPDAYSAFGEMREATYRTTMRDGPLETRKPDLGDAAALTVIVVGIVVATLLLYYLIDVLILLFLGVVVAAAVGPWHARWSRLGLPKGPAVLLIYLLFATALVVMGLLVVPVLIKERRTFAAAVPEDYATARAALHASPLSLLPFAGERLPPFAALPQGLSGSSAALCAGALGFTTGLILQSPKGLKQGPRVGCGLFQCALNTLCRLSTGVTPVRRALQHSPTAYVVPEGRPIAPTTIVNGGALTTE